SRAGIALAVAHLALVGSLGLKLFTDRATLPRGWARTVPVDPSLPIRGRYVSLRLAIPVPAGPVDHAKTLQGIRLRAVEGRLVGEVDDQAGTAMRLDSVNGSLLASLAEPVAYFIPEQVPDPSLRPAGEELWAEVTIPRRGPPRPIRLGIMKNGGITPLELR
ncbi:MAG: hypothetical protein ACREMX_03070, partial [Gemmatimonadales bacterium]